MSIPLSTAYAVLLNGKEIGRGSKTAMHKVQAQHPGSVLTYGYTFPSTTPTMEEIALLLGYRRNGFASPEMLLAIVILAYAAYTVAGWIL